MQTSTVHKARELSPDERRAVENLLGRRLEEEETVRVSAPAESNLPVSRNAKVEIPAWPGRAIGDLRREDIYEDVR
jgi:hypothetical protein